MNFGFYFVCKYLRSHNFFGIYRGCVSAFVFVYCFWFSISDLMYGWICNVRKLIETKNGAWSLRWGSSQKFVWRILIKRDPIFLTNYTLKDLLLCWKKKYLCENDYFDGLYEIFVEWWNVGKSYFQEFFLKSDCKSRRRTHFCLLFISNTNEKHEEHFFLLFFTINY